MSASSDKAQAISQIIRGGIDGFNTAREGASVSALTEDLLAANAGKSDINALITETGDIAREAAANSDKAIADGVPRALEGLPITVKDNFCTKGVLTTAGSKILSNYIPTYESTVTQNLWDAGAVMVGKSNLDQFGMGSSTTYSHYGATKNPTAIAAGVPEAVPGGSSGGAGASVAADMAIAGIGTDTGGSIRQPAAFCGKFGMKPTYGLCSRWGVIAYASSLDQAGVIAHNVSDVARVLNVMASEDVKDSTSLTGVTRDFSAHLGKGAEGLTIGLPSEFINQFNTPHTKLVWERLNEVAAKAGVTLKEVSLPNIAHALPAYYIIALSEASSNLARYDGVRYGFRAKDVDGIVEMYEKTRAEGFGEEVKRRIMLGTYTLSAGHYDQYYIKAAKLRRLIANDFAAAFEGVDVMAWPTTPSSAFEPGKHAADPVAMYLEDVFTVPVNLAGLPAISIPFGTCERNLPLGLTIAGPKLGDAVALQVAEALSAI